MHSNLDSETVFYYLLIFVHCKAFIIIKIIKGDWNYLQQHTLHISASYPL